MARPIQYGDPGQQPDHQLIYKNRAGERWRRNVALPLGGSPTNLQFGGGPGLQFGNILDWLAAPHGPEGVSFIGGGSAYSPPGAGAVGYDPVQEMRYTGLGGGALPPPQVTTTSAEGAGYAPGVYYPAAPAPGTLPSVSGYYPLAQYQNRNAPLATPMGEDGTTPAAGQKERIDYDTIREMEAGLKAAGKTGRTVPLWDEQGNLTIVQRDNQGRVLRITRDVTGRAASSALKWGNVGGTAPVKTQMRRHRAQEIRVKTTGEKHGWQAPRSAPATSGNNYPNWVINMSNWRGI